MTTKPTAVVVRLPLSEDDCTLLIDASSFGEPNDSHDKAILAIGTPVTGGELCSIGYINEDAIRGLATGVYRSASIFRDEDKEHYDTVALARLSDTQSQIAARDAEIARLREVLSLFTAYESLMDDGEDVAAMAAYANLQQKVYEALKGPEA